MVTTYTTFSGQTLARVDPKFPFFVGGGARIRVTVARGPSYTLIFGRSTPSASIDKDLLMAFAGEALVPLAGEPALGAGVVALATLAGEEALVTGVVDLGDLARGKAPFFFAAGVWAFAFAGDSTDEQAFFATLPVCTLSDAAAASWALSDSVVLLGELLVILRSGLSDLALVFLAGVVVFFLPLALVLALAGVPSPRAFAMAAVRCGC